MYVWAELASPKLAAKFSSAWDTSMTGAKTVTVSVLVSLPEALLAVIKTLALPVLAGVPLIKPVSGSMLSPAGSPLAKYVVGLLFAVIW